MENENYWKLIGEKGKVIDSIKNENGRVLVLFEKNLDDFKLENHNPVKNSLWIKKSDLELDQYRIYLQKSEKEAMRKTSLMNNTKWFKFFTEIFSQDIDIQHSKIKFLLSENEMNFSFRPNFNVTGFEDGSEGPFLFKEIEWLSINGQYEIERQNRNEKLKSKYNVQPIEKVKAILDGLGEFECAISDDNLIIYGYK